MGGEGIADWAAPELVEGLFHKSLVALDERESAARYTLLETVRAYAAERLAATGEQDLVRDRHLAWCLAMAEEARGKLQGPEQGVWLARLEREHDNLRAALDWTKERGAGEDGLRLAGALGRFWLIRGYLSEGRHRLDMALANSTHGPDAARAMALHAAGTLAEQQGDYGSAAALHEEDLALRRASGDTPGIARALTNLGNVAERQGQYTRATGVIEESLALERALGDTLGIAYSLGHLGFLAAEQGDLGGATALYEEALALRRDVGEKRGIAGSLNSLGMLAEQRGDHARATTLLMEGLQLGRQIGAKDAMADILESLARVDAAAREPKRAAVLGGAAEALREAIGRLAATEQGADHDRAVRAMRAALGKAAFAAAWAEGRAMPLERVIALALDVAPTADE